jgi:hypothetical protein
MTNNKALIHSLHTLLHEEMAETITTGDKTTGKHTTKNKLNKDGKVKLWIKIAEDKELWNWQIIKLQAPGLSIPPPKPNRTRQPPPSLTTPTCRTPPHHSNQTCHPKTIGGETRTTGEKNTCSREIDPSLPPHLLHCKPLRRTTTEETGILKAWDTI